MEIEDFIKLSYLERYEYTLGEIASKKEIWILRRSDGYISANLGVNDKIEMTVWCSEVHASYDSCGVIKGEPIDVKPEKLTFDVFNNEVLPKLKANNVKILVSPMRDVRGKVITYNEFLKKIGLDAR